jgi:hypothetical protein
LTDEAEKRDYLMKLPARMARIQKGWNSWRLIFSNGNG